MRALVSAMVGDSGVEKGLALPSHCGSFPFQQLILTPKLLGLQGQAAGKEARVDLDDILASFSIHY